MNLKMLPVEIIGLKTDLRKIVHTLRQIGCLHIDELSEIQEISARPLILDRETLRLQEEQNFLLARIEGLLDTLNVKGTIKTLTPLENYLGQAQAGVELLIPEVQSLVSRRDRLQAEFASLPRYEITLRKLLPMIPSSASEAGNRSISVLVSRVHG